MTTTDRDVRAYVEVALEDAVDSYDVDGIVDELRGTNWWPVPHRPIRVLDAMDDFWDLVARHERPDAARRVSVAVMRRRGRSEGADR